MSQDNYTRVVKAVVGASTEEYGGVVRIANPEDIGGGGGGSVKAVDGVGPDETGEVRLNALTRAELGTPGGVAPLNELGLVPGQHLPPSPSPGGAGFNTREILTKSGAYTAPVTGWYRAICIGGGGSGGVGGSNAVGGLGGKRGGTTTFGTLSAAGGPGGGGGGPGAGGGGGGTGDIVEEFVHLEKDQSVPVTVGAGGLSVSGTVASGATGGDGEGPYAGRGGVSFGGGGIGAPGASNGSTSRYDSWGGTGGSGAATRFLFGNGGGGSGAAGGAGSSPRKGGSAASGASFGGDSTTAAPGDGGAGGAGAVILEYFNPALDA